MAHDACLFTSLNELTVIKMFLMEAFVTKSRDFLLFFYAQKSSFDRNLLKAFATVDAVIHSFFIKTILRLTFLLCISSYSHQFTARCASEDSHGCPKIG